MTPGGPPRCSWASPCYWLAGQLGTCVAVVCSRATRPASRECRCRGQVPQRRLQVLLGELRVGQRTAQVGVVGAQIEVAVTAEAEEDDPRLARLARRLGLLDHGPD